MVTANGPPAESCAASLLRHRENAARLQTASLQGLSAPAGCEPLGGLHSLFDSARRETKRAMVVRCGASVPHSVIEVTWRSLAEAMARLGIRPREPPSSTSLSSTAGETVGAPVSSLRLKASNASSGTAPSRPGG